MKDNIFAELYNKLLGFFRQAEEEQTAKDVACNRLRVVLMQDRTNLTPEILQKMRKELITLLSKYLEMDNEALELNLEQEGEQMALMLSIPVIRAKEESEIEKDSENIEEKSNENQEEITSESEDDNNKDEKSNTDDVETDDNKNENEMDNVENKNTTPHKQESENKIKFPNKEICGECRECEFSEDIECEKKK